jgi:hypothetical protein
LILDPLTWTLPTIYGLNPFARCCGDERSETGEFKLSFNVVKNRSGWRALSVLASALAKYPYGDHVQLVMWHDDHARKGEIATAGGDLCFALVGKPPATPDGLADHIRKHTAACGLPY